MYQSSVYSCFLQHMFIFHSVTVNQMLVVLITVWDLYVGNAVLGPTCAHVMQPPVLHILLGELPDGQDSGWRCSPYLVSCLSVPHSCACGGYWKASQPRYGPQIPTVWHQGKTHLLLWEASWCMMYCIKQLVTICTPSYCHNWSYSDTAVTDNWYLINCNYYPALPWGPPILQCNG